MLTIENLKQLNNLTFTFSQDTKQRSSKNNSVVKRSIYKEVNIEMAKDKEIVENPKQPSDNQMTQPVPALATECVVNLIRSGDILLNRVQQVCRLFGLTLSTANALAILDGAGEPLSPHVVGQRLLVTSGAVTQIIDALEKQDLVRRINNPHDRRSVLIEVTPQGKQLREKSEPYLNKRDEVWMGGLKKEEQATLVYLLGKLQNYLETLPQTGDTSLVNEGVQ